MKHGLACFKSTIVMCVHVCMLLYKNDGSAVYKASYPNRYIIVMYLLQKKTRIKILNE